MNDISYKAHNGSESLRDADRLPEKLRVLVLPPRNRLSDSTKGVVEAPAHGFYETRLREIQRLRALVYVDDGAISRALLDDRGGLPVLFDEDHWHLTVWASDEAPAGTLSLRLLDAPCAVEELRLWTFIDKLPAEKRSLYVDAIQRRMDQARSDGLSLGEVSALAVLPEFRLSMCSAVMMWGSWALCKAASADIVFSATTARHHTAQMQKSFGASSLNHGDATDLPPFFNPNFSFPVEILATDCRYPPRRYETLIESLAGDMRTSFSKNRDYYWIDISPPRLAERLAGRRESIVATS